MDDGLPESSVRDLAFGPDGYLWLVTPHHLCRFDGVRFREALPELSTNAIPAGPFDGLHFDRSGRLWVFGQQGAWYFTKGAWTTVVPGPGAPGGGAVRRLAEGADGTIWLLDERILRAWRAGRLESFPVPPELPITSVKLFDVAVDDEGMVWLAAADRVLRFQAGRFEPVTLPDLPIETSLRINRISYARGSGRVWTANAYYLFCRERGEWRGSGLANDIIKIRKIEALVEVGPGDLWIGNKVGVYRYKDGQWGLSFSSAGVTPANCSTVAPDEHGNVWLGSDGGLVRLAPCRVSEFELPKALPSRRVGTVTVMDDDRIGVAIPGVGAYLQDMTTAGRLLPLSLINPKYQSSVTVVWRHGDGAWWYGTRGEGFRRNIRGSEAYSMYWGTPRNEDKGLLVKALLETSDGRLWVGTGDGLMDCREPLGSMVMAPVGPVAMTRTLYEDRDGALWCGYEAEGLLRRATNGTVTHYRQGDGLPGPGVLAVCRDADGVLWLGGRDGLARWAKGGEQPPTSAGTDSGVPRRAEGGGQRSEVRSQRSEGRGQTTDHGRRTLFTAVQGLPPGPVVQIVPDERGGLWLGTSSGIARLDRRELARVAGGEDVPLTMRLMDCDDGLPSAECTGGLLLKGWQPFLTNLWFGTAAGLAQIEPGKIPLPGQPPKVVFESLAVDGRLKILHEPLVALSRAFPASVRLAPESRRIEIGFIAPGGARPERVRFRYRLDGGAWSPITAQRAAVYEWLAPGRHRFDVMGIGSDGTPSGTPATLELEVEPWFWQTGWFIAGVALLGLGVAAGGMRWWQRRRYRRRLAELEHQKDLYEERARIARDLHDEIGSKLSRLSFLGELLHRSGAEAGAGLSRAAEMVATARATLRAFENVVWAVSPRHDTVKALANHVCKHAEDFFSGTPVACRFKVDELLADWPVAPRVRNELFLAVKEALNNVLKHSGATTVEIVIVTRARLLEIGISDNGCGFDGAGVKPPSAGEVHGTGLRNMRQRLASLGGACRIEGGPGAGTRVVFEMEVR